MPDTIVPPLHLVPVAERMPPPGVRVLVYAPKVAWDKPEIHAVASWTERGW